MHLLNSFESELTIKICRFLSECVFLCVCSFSNSHNEEKKTGAIKCGCECCSSYLNTRWVKLVGNSIKIRIKSLIRIAQYEITELYKAIGGWVFNRIENSKTIVLDEELPIRQYWQSVCFPILVVIYSSLHVFSFILRERNVASHESSFNRIIK